MKQVIAFLLCLPFLVAWPSINLGGGQTSGSSETQVTGRPLLRDLYSSMNSRVPAVNGVALEAYADARDTIAELSALGWTTTNVAAVDCANNSTVDTGLQTALTAAADNTILYLNGTAPCYYNVTTTLTLQDNSNVLVVGRGRDDTFIMSDIPVVANSGAIGFVLGASGAFSLYEATTFTWASGFDMGTTSVGITDAAGGDEVDAGERLWLQATDSQGSVVPFTSVVASISGTAPNRVAVLEDPLPVDYGGTSATIKIYKAKNNSSGWVDHVGLMDLTIDQTQSSRTAGDADTDCEPPGSQPTASCPWFGFAVVEFRNVRHARLERVNFPHSFNKFVSLHGNPTNGNGDHAIFRGNWFDELYMAHSRANNNGAISQGAPHAVSNYLVNNVLGDRTPRLYTYEGSSDAAIGHTIAWNYQPPAEVISGADTVCAAGVGGGRSIFFGHSGDDSPYVGTITESNDFECHFETEAVVAGASGLRNVIYRNRMVRTQNGSKAGIYTGSSSYATHMTFILNRVRNLDGNSGGTFAHQGADVWMSYNAAESVCDLAANGASGGCAGDASNYADDTYTGNVLSTSAVTVTSSATYPVSMVLTDPPSWWCQEACSWLDTAGPGAQEAGGGTYCKLPAQIIAEGGTCTACASNPSACLD